MNLKHGLALGMALATLYGCAGTNFVQPSTQALQLGKSSKADVVKLMGSPSQTGEVVKNEKKLDTTSYAYARNTGVGAYPDVIAARALTYTFLNGTLTSREYVSSFKDDPTDFDSDKVSQIIKGKSTREDVIALLGKPNGEAIYPVIPQNGDSAVIYSYQQTKGNVFNLKFYSKALTVSFSPSGVVDEVIYNASGNR